MSGRGRGGRGGRGGVSKSFNREQLSSMGISGSEVLPGPVTQPPPLYPLLDHYPTVLPQSPEIDYLLILKQDFLDQLHLSASYLRMPLKATSSSNDLVTQLPQVKEHYNWALFPSELRPKVLAKRVKKEIKEVNVQEKLEELEKIESSKKEEGKIKIEQPENDDQNEEDLEEEMDEEMDDGTDYANNYFDNGEDYEEEDDNLDDGPIY